MPIKYYCDRCEKEIQWNTVSQRAIVDFQGWQAEVMLRNPKMAWNDGFLCEACLKLMLQLGCFSKKTGSVALSQKGIE